MNPRLVPLPHYAKPWLPYPDQVALLVSRGLVVADAAAAGAFLAHLNYYRFSGYCLAFEKARHEFQAGATFEQVQAAYNFDMALRDLVTDGLEAIEVDVRATMAYVFGQKYGGFGHADATNFFPKFNHADWLLHIREEATRSSELFVVHFRSTYAEYPDLPVWVLTELISFGTLTRMYRGMQRPDQQAIATRYGLQAQTFGTILLHLVYVRNLCAHHARLWDRLWSVKPALPHGKMWRPPVLPGNPRLFATVCLMRYLLCRCKGIGTIATQWRNRLLVLLHNPPDTPQAPDRMGMPADWDQHPLWK